MDLVSAMVTIAATVVLEWGDPGGTTPVNRMWFQSHTSVRLRLSASYQLDFVHSTNATISCRARHPQMPYLVATFASEDANSSNGQNPDQNCMTRVSGG
jgi:hypothetical protein